MKNKLTLLRIIETILQVIIVPLIIVTQFAYMTNGYGELQLMNFLDSADWADGYLAAIGMVILVVITLLFTWTPICKWTAIPAFFEIVLIGRTIAYVSKLHSAGAPDHLGPLAVPDMGLFSKKEKVYPKVSDIFSEECLQKILAVVKPRLENGGYGNKQNDSMAKLLCEVAEHPDEDYGDLWDRIGGIIFSAGAFTKVEPSLAPLLKEAVSKSKAFKKANK